MSGRIKRGAAVWAIIGALFLAWSVFALGANTVERSRIKDAGAQAQRVERFYQMVNGEISGSEGPANKLARDLRALPADQLEEFRGDSNKYGGITSELGFDPFNGVDCSECGELDFEIIENVRAIKDGGLDQVLAEVENEVPIYDSRSGPPILLWLLWLFSLPIAAAVAYLQRRRSEENKYRDFAEERHILHQLREVKGELPPGSDRAHAIGNLADNLEAQIDERVSYKKSKAQEMKLGRMMLEAIDALEAIKAGNETLE